MKFDIISCGYCIVLLKQIRFQIKVSFRPFLCFIPQLQKLQPKAKYFC